MINSALKTTLYGLNRNYGAPIDYYHIVSIADSIDTGKSITEKVKYHFNRAICLPVNMAREMFVPNAYKKDGSIPSRNVEAEDRLIIIYKRNLPKGFEYAEKDYVITSHKRGFRKPKRFNIAKMEEYEDDIALVFYGKFVQGGQLAQIVDAKVKESITIIETTE